MFVLSKLLQILIDPATVVFLLAAIGWLLLFTARKRLGRRLVGIALAILVVGGVLPLDELTLQWLEGRFPAAERLPERVDGVIVLGGAIDPVISAARGQVAVNGAVERLTALVPLAARYPEARLVFSGGSGAVLTQEYKEAGYAADFLRQIGLDPGRVVLENQSRNTRENAAFTKAMLQPAPGQTWLLVTSAVHMPRAMGCFRAVGWQVVPYPVDYQTTGTVTLTNKLRFSFGLGGYNGVLHELVGLAAYWLVGWSDSLLPAPN